MVGKQGVKSSWTLSSLWTLPLRGQLSLEGSRDHRGLQLVSSYGRQNLSLSAALNTLHKVEVHSILSGGRDVVETVPCHTGYRLGARKALGWLVCFLSQVCLNLPLF